MQKRKLGKSAMEVSTLVLGGNVFGWTADEPTSFKLLDAFIAAGGNCIDTADTYSRWVPNSCSSIMNRLMKDRYRLSAPMIALRVATSAASSS